VERDALETVRAEWEKAVAATSKLVTPLSKIFLGDESIKIQYFHKAVFHPFVKVNPPLLAVAQVAVTDEYINRSIRNSMIELAIVASIFFILAFWLHTCCRVSS
jgi:hypothetical protein